ncbi:cation-translocating P-type ATPase [Meiothermus ruber]|jgi:Ca2+-transporting ATPase|uniref:ATPase P-type (Transporting), HAD superfamily, subfamily IC n=1 Tax=Meiothermus ruber (strain ATCC 35948 / DSM 1279 / VKM B-1258 / 21) TaxID=504728 RepID=D3PPL8_MEIRD|nr:cation-translocating P-type ATPase [Meiothermus ruber]ADD29632.1 ATPase, P-type (transporting), HAD superfamily, subfamily IC [Meiothermus ruber DSM 1279]AGK04915.1 ATPase P-type (transporting), HAD superfamily, subfamily IC [Meiothermus ruber DSM 1279]
MNRTGLSQREAADRLARYGPNALPEQPPEPLWRRFLRQFRSPLIYILLFALLVELALWLYEGRQGTPFEALAILTILLFNAGLGVWQERRAENALARLRALAAPQVWVLREGVLTRISSQQLVPGDLVRLEAGERIPADGLLVEGQGLMVDESVLTGESLPVDKGPGEEVLAGTLALRGTGWIELTRTGSHSAMGRLAQMLGSIRMEKTPLERRLDVFGHQVARWVGLLALALLLGILLVEGPAHFSKAFLFTVALAVAAVPEGLPAVLTLALALGVERMAGRKAVVRRLSAVEALGSVTVIATDKTGTLTQNQMEVRATDLPDLLRGHRAMALASDAEPGSPVGDPLELALLEHLRKAGMDVQALRQAHPRLSSRPFDSAWKYMRVTVKEADQAVSYLKGAPEVLLARCQLEPHERALWQEKIEAYARQGHRLLAFAWGPGEGEDRLTWLGLALLWDPPRPEVPEAIRRAQAAGIRVLMITGDHPATALAVAQQVGIPGQRVLTGEDIEGHTPEELQQALREVNVFARVSPEHKLHLVNLLKAQGEIVAMTGDGINDAPALKRADVGVAMGQRGSDVSREVADLVLLDDNFATIVNAVEEGRNIYENIRSFIRFLFSTNVALVLLVAGGVIGAALLGLRDATGALLVPLTAVQLLWINIIADGPPALALSLDRHPEVMRRPPYDPRQPLLDRFSLTFILGTGVVKAGLGLALLALLPLYQLAPVAVRSALFLYESLAQLLFAQPSRLTTSRPSGNPILLLILLASAGLQILTVTLEPLRAALGLTSLPWPAWGLVGAALLLSWAFAMLFVAWLRRHNSVQARAHPLR